MRLAGYVNTILTRRRLQFNRQELSGAFGDIGTDLPLLVGMVMASGIDAGWAFLLFGVLQIASALIYAIL
ncbi:MAG: molybdate transporter family protein [Candidatus Latescibacter sp.]|nr:molybdate transporter family protein [Candidatus Latescibacter sp.]